MVLRWRKVVLYVASLMVVIGLWRWLVVASRKQTEHGFFAEVVIVVALEARSTSTTHLHF